MKRHAAAPGGEYGQWIFEIISGVVENHVAEPSAEDHAQRRPDQEIVDGDVIGDSRRTRGQAAHQPPAQQKPADIGQRVPADDERAEADQHRIDNGERNDKGHGASGRFTGQLHR